MGSRPWARHAGLRPERARRLGNTGRCHARSRTRPGTRPAKPDRLAQGNPRKTRHFFGPTRLASPGFPDNRPARSPGRRLHLGGLPGDARRRCAQRPTRCTPPHQELKSAQTSTVNWKKRANLKCGFLQLRSRGSTYSSWRRVRHCGREVGYVPIPAIQPPPERSVS